MTANAPEDLTPSLYSDNAEFWITVIRQDLDNYRTDLTHDAVLDAVAPQPGIVVLDAGCGEGWLTRACGAAGAHAIGVDSCPEFIDAARTTGNPGGLTPTYELGDVTSLPIHDGSVHVVVANHVLNDVADMDAAIREFARVLVLGGRLVLLVVHPCFYASQPNRGRGAPHLTADEYFTERTLRQPFRIAGVTSPGEIVVHLRPLEHYTAALTRWGFTIDVMTEPHPSPEQIEANPWWRDNFHRPLFLLIEATRHPKPYDRQQANRMLATRRPQGDGSAPFADGELGGEKVKAPGISSATR